MLFQLATTVGILVAQVTGKQARRAAATACGCSSGSRPAPPTTPAPALQLVNYGVQDLSWGWRLSLGLAIVPATLLTIGACSCRPASGAACCSPVVPAHLPTAAAAHPLASPLGRRCSQPGAARQPQLAAGAGAAGGGARGAGAPAGHARRRCRHDCTSNIAAASLARSCHATSLRLLLRAAVFACRSAACPRQLALPVAEFADICEAAAQSRRLSQRQAWGTLLQRQYRPAAVLATVVSCRACWACWAGVNAVAGQRGVQCEGSHAAAKPPPLLLPPCRSQCACS